MTRSLLNVSFDPTTRTVSVAELEANQERRLLSFKLTEGLGGASVEQTLGQLVLHALNRITPGGLGFGDYADLFNQISEENFDAFQGALDLCDPADQNALATFMLSRGKRLKSWSMIEKAIELFRCAANGGDKDAERFMQEDLPLVLPRLQKLCAPVR